MREVPTEFTVDGVCVRIVEPAMRQVFALLDRVAAARTSILLQGETGVGKEVAARYLHQRSPRGDRPFVAVNCAAIPEPLAESELFGFERGAFTGATSSRVGLLEAAHGGTIFLDEIGDLPATMQARLLRAVGDGRVRPLGARQERAIDVRLVSATNRDLLDDVRAKRFRKDLVFRIGASIVHIPPLRHRRLEVPHLASTLLNTERARLGRVPLEISADAMRLLEEHDWPGNVRELKHVMELAAASASEGASEIGVEDISLRIERVDLDNTDRESQGTASSIPGRFVPIELQIRSLVRAQMILALDATGGNQAEAARSLEMPRRTFVLRMRQYQITPAEYRRRPTPRS